MGGNVIVTPDGKALIVGSPERGWLIVTPDRCLSARTAQGVELALEELDILPLGWA